MVLLAQELAARTSDRRIYINSVNPGDVATGFSPPLANRSLISRFSSEYVCEDVEVGVVGV